MILIFENIYPIFFNYEFFSNTDRFLVAIVTQKCKKFRVGERCCEFECLDGSDDIGPDVFAVDSSGSPRILEQNSVLCLLTGLIVLLMVP